MKIVICILTAAFLIALRSEARAADTVIAAGDTLTLKQDLILSGNDKLELDGAADKPCKIDGGGHAIVTSGEWTGKINISHATCEQLGKTQAVIKIPSNNGGWPTFKIDDPDAPGFKITAAGAADISIRDCNFEQSSFLLFTTNGNSTFTFSKNTVSENSLFPVSEMPSTSRACITLEGKSTAAKFFQGNRIYKGECRFHTSNVMIGGDRDEDSNLIIGIRAKIDASGKGTVIRGNYLHVLLLGPEVPPHFAYWSQVATFSPGEGTIAEHNIIRDGEWIVRFVEGEFRYNLICDINDHDLCQNGSVGRIHHNIFFGSKPDHVQGSMGACIAVIYKPKSPDSGVEIFNNTFDGCGWLPVPGVAVGSEGFVKSLRNNVFFNFALAQKAIHGTNAMIRTDWNEDAPTPPPSRMAYADYNLFDNPLNKIKTIYALGVAGKTVRKDAGWALNDIQKGGPIDENVDPKFKGPLPRSFPFKDEEIKAGKVTMSQMLKFFRDAYTPAEGSPLIGAGDLADGAGTDIGAVGAGKANDADRFGRFGDAPAVK